MKRSYLYLLVYTDKKVIKIGKADDVSKRIYSLKQHWGEPNYEHSYSLEMDAEDVFKIEKSLHLFLSEHAAVFEDGDGRTEFFASNCLEQALEYIELYIRRSSKKVIFKQGVEAPLSRQDIGKVADNKLKKYTKNRVALIDSMNSVSSNLELLMRIVSILIKYRAQIKYHYEIDGDYLTFNIEDKRLVNLALKNHKQLCAIFFISINGFGSSDSVNTFDSMGGGNNDHSLYVLMRINNHPAFSEYDPLKVFFIEKIKSIILSLPQKSPAYIQAKEAPL